MSQPQTTPISTYFKRAGIILCILIVISIAVYPEWYKEVITVAAINITDVIFHTIKVFLPLIIVIIGLWIITGGARGRGKH